MACCPPSCVIPSCSSMPLYGLGSCGIGGGLGGGLGSFGSSGRSVSSAELGTLPGVTPQTISQLPSSELVIQPSPIVVVMPGAALAATCEPISVGGGTLPGSSSGGRLGSLLRRGSSGGFFCSLPR